MEVRTFNYTEDKIDIDVSFDPNVYLNATEIYQAFGKKYSTFNSWQTRKLIPYAKRLIELGKFPLPQNEVTADPQGLTAVILVKQGGTPQEQGTWLHPKLAVMFARWLSLDFEIWCDEKIEELLAEGIVELTPADAKYEKHYKSILTRVSVEDKIFIKDLRKLLIIHEEEGRNIKHFADLMTALSAKMTKDNRVQMYEKILKGIEVLYQADKLDITTREKMKSIAHDRIIRTLKGRETRLQNKLDRSHFTIKGEKDLTDVEDHDWKVELTTQLAEVTKQRDEAIDKINGIGKDDIKGLVPVYLPTIDSITGLKNAVEKIEAAGHNIMFNDTMTPPEFKPNTTKRLPEGTGAYLSESFGGMAAAVWYNETNIYTKVSASYMSGDDAVKAEIAMWPQAYDTNMYKGFNSNKTVCAVYNAVTNRLLVYSIAL